jgi:SAM-dependent methyltransferase
VQSIFRHKMERSGASHAILDTASRKRKAQKIVAILDQDRPIKGSKLLDIGTGSGHIAHEFSKHVKTVDSVDIVDERKEKKGYKFKVVKNEKLPFKDAQFDVVVSNHVVEHTPSQDTHLSEIYRVLKPGGVVYLATPNKYWLTDPHYKLPFISWLPRKASEKYLDVVQKKQWDIYPLSHRGIKKHFPDARVKNALPTLIKTNASSTLDTMNSITKVARVLPAPVLETTRYFSPTLIYVIEKPKKR